MAFLVVGLLRAVQFGLPVARMGSEEGVALHAHRGNRQPGLPRETGYGEVAGELAIDPAVGVEFTGDLRVCFSAPVAHPQALIKCPTGKILRPALSDADCIPDHLGCGRNTGAAAVRV